MNPSINIKNWLGFQYSLTNSRAVLSTKGALGVSPVCDSFDLFNSIENIICKQLKPLLRERGEKGRRRMGAILKKKNKTFIVELNPPLTCP